jgi:hypothetical protein
MRTYVCVTLRAGDPAGMDQIDRTPEKDPNEWTTGDEPMTGPQESYLETLAREAGEDLDRDLTKAEASQRIDQLQDRTGRGG